MPERDEQLLRGSVDVAIGPSGRPSTALIEAIEAISGHEPRDARVRASDGSDGLSRLAGAIDPETSNAFVRSTARRDGRADE